MKCYEADHNNHNTGGGDGCVGDREVGVCGDCDAENPRRQEIATRVAKNVPCFIV